MQSAPVCERLVNLDVLAQYVGNDPLLQRRISQRFLESTRQAVAEMQQAAEQDGFARICNLAHRIRPSAVAMGAARLGELATHLERASRDQCSEKVREQLAKLTAILAQLEGEIASLTATAAVAK